MVAPARIATLTAISLAVLVAGSVAVAGGGPASAPVTQLASRATGPQGAAGNGNSVTPSISASGRFVAFTSRATNLNGADTSADRDVYVRDMRTGSTELVSRADGAGGASAAGLTLDPSISAGGRYVAFSSIAANLGTGDNPGLDVFVRDRVAGTTVLASRASGVAGPPGDEFSGAPSLSADGRHVAFESQANNLSLDDRKENTTDIFVRNLDTGVTTLVSRASGPAGPAADDLSFDPSISGNGGRVAFTSRSALGTDDVDGGFEDDVFVRDVATNTTILVSRKSGAAGAPSEVESDEPAISRLGGDVAFTSNAKLTGQRFFSPNVFVRDLGLETTRLVSVGDEGTAGDAFRRPSISADGRVVAFQSRADEISPVDAPGRADVFVRNMRRNVTVVASRASGRLGLPGDGPSFNPSMSGNGRFVAFDSRAANFSGADDEDLADVFRRKLVFAREARLPECRGRVATMLGSGDADRLAGTRRKDVIISFGGRDRIRSFAEDDVICAGAGADSVFAGTESNLVLGGPGADRLSVGPELSNVIGGRGDDVLLGSSGGEGLSGGPGDDVLRGRGNPPFNTDFLFGGPGDDFLFGGPGTDQLRGGPGNDVLDFGPGGRQ